MNNNLLPIAKEGFSRIGFTILAFIIFAILDLELLEFFSFLTLIFFIFVYRNPERMIPNFEQMSVVSPVDGVLISIEELENEEYAYKLEINSSYLNVSLLRTPLSSKIETIDIKHGARLSQLSPLARDVNERVEVVFQDSHENNVKVSHMLKQSFDDIKLDVITKQNLVQGSRYGLMVNGITTVYLPQNFRVNVSVGQELNASQTLVGYFS
ncbi:phosphatidylserine decarboxylase [Sulfurimonas sp.]|uniref:phosphatidylserine decarboxylase n=1 Tax=Sulfurimonas sp. TaxID=2022749 RepID=UPI0035623A5C